MPERPELTNLRTQLMGRWRGEPDVLRRVDDAIEIVDGWWAELRTEKDRELSLWLAARRELSEQLRQQVLARLHTRDGQTECEAELEHVKGELQRVYDELDTMTGWSGGDD